MIVLWILGIISGLLTIIFASLSTKHYYLAQFDHKNRKEKGLFGVHHLDLTFDETNYIERGLVHRKKHFSYAYKACVSIFSLIFIIVIGRFFRPIISSCIGVC